MTPGHSEGWEVNERAPPNLLEGLSVGVPMGAVCQRWHAAASEGTLRVQAHVR